MHKLFLDLCEFPLFDEPPLGKAQRILSDLDTVSDVLAALDVHALGPIFWQRMKKHLSGDIRTGAKLLAWRYKRVHQVRLDILRKALTALESIDSCPVLLKGAALIANNVYPSGELRPMRDIDIFIRQDRCLEAVQALKDIGFIFCAPDETNVYPVHHHLPNAKYIAGDIVISVELHYRLFAFDGKRSPEPKEIYEHAVSIYYKDCGIDCRVLDQYMTLIHLWRNQLGLAYHPRFIGYLDAILVALSVAEDDWVNFRATCPQMVNYIQMLFRVFGIKHPIASNEISSSAGFGIGVPTFHEAFSGSEAMWDSFFRPTDWWLHAFYGIPEEQSLSRGFWLYHRLNLCRRVFDKINNYFRSFFTDPDKFL